MRMAHVAGLAARRFTNGRPAVPCPSRRAAGAGCRTVAVAVKWLLIIPHVVVLFFLWCAVTVLTVVAGFAILFTGRYPRAIFDFNVGVMRWTWRVSVDYPQQLSRGLVLVKWWPLRAAIRDGPAPQGCRFAPLTWHGQQRSPARTA
jgi:hypothetical protein